MPFFYPYSATIEYIDQYVRISHLPWGFWEEHILTALLKSIGIVVHVDHNTLLKKKGKFVRVCLHIDVTKPLPGTLTIPTPSRQLNIPITYEGLHEVCTLCGASDHLLELYPSLPITPKWKLLWRNSNLMDCLTSLLPLPPL